MPTVTFSFNTMNNVIDPASLSNGQIDPRYPVKGECVDIVNFDCLNDAHGNDAGIRVRSRLITGLVQQPVTETMGSRNYWAVGNTVYCSKAMSADEDQRFSTVISLDDMITMIRRVGSGPNSGLFVGSTTELHYLAGSDPQVGGQDDHWTLPFGVVLGTGCHVKGELVRAAEMAGNCCIFVSQRGVFVGGPGGNIVNLSQDKVSYSFGLFGSACVREENGQAHYLFKTSNEALAYNPYVPLAAILGRSVESIIFSEHLS